MGDVERSSQNNPANCFGYGDRRFLQNITKEIIRMFCKNQERLPSDPPAASCRPQSSGKCGAMPSFIPRWRCSVLKPTPPPKSNATQLGGVAFWRPLGGEHPRIARDANRGSHSALEDRQARLSGAERRNLCRRRNSQNVVFGTVTEEFGKVQPKNQSESPCQIQERLPSGAPSRHLPCE